MGLRFKSKDDEKRVLVKLQDAAAAHPEQFTVYTHETMPEKYHFKHHERIAPVYVVPQLGWSLTSSKQHDDPNLIGVIMTSVCVRLSSANLSAESWLRQ